MEENKQEDNNEKNYQTEDKYSKIRGIILEHIYNNNFIDIYNATKVYYFMLYSHITKEEKKEYEEQYNEAKKANQQIKEEIHQKKKKIDENITQQLEKFFLLLEKKREEIQNKTPKHILKTK
jgi:transcription termination factor NusB